MVACALAFWLGGMSLSDAIAFAFSAVSTGGFAPYDASMGIYDSPRLDMIGALFMLHYTVWNRRTFKLYAVDTEFRGYAAFLLALFLVVVAGRSQQDRFPPGRPCGTDCFSS